MTANTAPRYTVVGDNASNAATGMAPTLTTAAADFTGISTNNQLVFTAGTNGSRLIGIHFEAIGTNAASVARVYINNGSANTTAANNSLIGQLTLPATTTSAVAAVGSADFYFPNGALDLDISYRIYVGLGTTVAAGWVPTPTQGGDF
ncbi:MAG: hypothetical protein JWN26_229 [Candidatus Saccharibacteria bacterium]|nr:hypothetical protein [Candidatus Saccharibacteria bacterium]